MLAIVRIALQRPYTFVVMAMLILIFGVMAWVKTPTDVFPDINIPVVSVVWTYNGLPPDAMSGRIIYYYERTLSSQVNDIRHMESQSLTGYGIVKVFFQPTVNINTALAQVTAASQTVLKFLPPGITPPYVLFFNASSVPVLQLAISSKTMSQAKLFDYAQNFIRPQLATVAGAAIPSPYGGKVRQVQVDINQRKLQSYGLSAQDVVNALAHAKSHHSDGHGRRSAGSNISSTMNDAPQDIAELNALPIKWVDNAMVYIGDVAYVHDSAPPQINMVRVDGAHAVLMTIQKAGAVSTLDVINGVKALLPKIRASLPRDIDIKAVGDQSAFVQASVDSVLREGAIAAALTGLMILLFLGSWRSTTIILISIPLAVLGSIAIALRHGRNDQRDDARRPGSGRRHSGRRCDRDDREHQLPSRAGQGDRTRDHGRRPPDRRSGDRLPALHLHRLRADVRIGRRLRLSVQADGQGGGVCARSFPIILSRTLVNTLARHLLAAQAHARGRDEHEPPPSRNPLVRFQRGFEHRFENVRAGYRDLLRARVGARLVVHHWLSARRRRVFQPCAVPRAELLSLRRIRSDQAARPGADGNQDRGDGKPLRRDRGGDPRRHSA